MDGSGTRLPHIVVPPPGPRARALSLEIERFEAPGINAVQDGVAMVWRTARGSNVWDVDGNRYIDLTAGFGVAAVGHAAPEVVTAIEGQARQLVHGLGDAASHPLRATLARALVERVPVDDGQVYFAVSGSDAVEIAVKSALLSTGRAGIVAFDPGYHGLTLGALAVTSRPAFRGPFEAQIHRHVRRLSFGCDATDLESALEDRQVACVVVEPVVGREGVILPPTGWLAAVADACRETGTLLVADEIFTGFGRTGHWFAVDHDGVRPDLLCCGKALGGGLPIGAVVGRRELLAAWRTPGEALHTGTFVANPLALAASLAVLEILEGQDLPARAAALGDAIAPRLEALLTGSAARAIRGRGLLWGIECRERSEAYRIADRLRGRGVLMLAGGPRGTVLQIAPPLTIARRQLDFALDQLDEVF